MCKQEAIENQARNEYPIEQKWMFLWNGWHGRFSDTPIGSIKSNHTTSCPRLRVTLRHATGIPKIDIPMRVW